MQSGPLAKSSGIFHAETRGTDEDSPYCDNKGMKAKMITAATEKKIGYFFPKLDLTGKIFQKNTHTPMHIHIQHTHFLLYLSL